MTLSDALPKIRDLAELDGFTDQLERDGNLTVEARQAIAMRRAEIMRGRK